ncbi:MAG: hypothetical protein QGH93_07985 [Gammaproteobacteria bacterium]|jgi:hypothetical protein|nr:hypothetical protein [Chromatiales bacterium]MDP6674767.1 hypothetical protein [Gammaproteobacteria bacterium]
MIDPAWEGKVQFYELVFGTWLTDTFLVLMWERALKAKKAEWIYALITFLGASFFWINHYFQHAPFYGGLLNGYTLVFFTTYYAICVHAEGRSVVWKIAAILFENIARYFVDGRGVNEFWFMLIAYFGFIWLIIWRGKTHSLPRE